MITSDRKIIKLIDFDISRTLGSGSLSTTTFYYIPPEIFNGEEISFLTKM
jgi:serine/threonine protein kinase